MASRACAAMLGLMWAGNPALADDRQIALGRHLAQECVTCHKVGPGAAAIPPLAGLDADYIVTTMGYYKSGARNNPAMVSVAMSLDDAQVKALAAYFASQPKSGSQLEPASTATSPKARKK